MYPDQAQRLFALMNRIGREIGDINPKLDNLNDTLKRIADSLEQTKNKTKEEMLNKVKQALK